MQPESAKLLTDILDAVNRIMQYTSGKTREEYLGDGELRDAVQWNFLVIGEALAQLHKLDPVTAEQIGQWRRIIGFRNQLIHGYGVIKNEITWDIVENKIPALFADVRKLLDISQD
jgi:uncharacterized protein with HEPN domain